MLARTSWTSGYRRPHAGETMLAAGAPLVCAIVMLVLPGVGIGGGAWAIVVTLFPASAAACFGLACAGLSGSLAGLTAGAIGSRQPVRSALQAVVVTALLAPAPLAVPLWPALFAAAGLLLWRAPCRLSAANDNEARRPRNPFALAA